MAEKTLEEMREVVAAIRETMAAAAREAGRDPAGAGFTMGHKVIIKRLGLPPIPPDTRDSEF